MSNNDEEYQHFKAMAQRLNNGPTLPLAQSRSYPVDMDPTMHRQATIVHQQHSSNLQKCTCNQSNIGEFNMSHDGQRSSSHAGHCIASGQAQCNYQQPPQFMGCRPREQQLPRQHSQAKSDIQAGTNIPQEQPSELLISLRLQYDQMPDHVRAAIRSILFIADTIKNEDDENSAIEDWESMSMVVDRLFLWIFFLLCTFGSLIILALAPSLYDQRDSIDDKLRIEIPASNCSAFES